MASTCLGFITAAVEAWPRASLWPAVGEGFLPVVHGVWPAWAASQWPGVAGFMLARRQVVIWVAARPHHCWWHDSRLQACTLLTAGARKHGDWPQWPRWPKEYVATYNLAAIAGALSVQQLDILAEDGTPSRPGKWHGVLPIYRLLGENCQEFLHCLAWCL